MSLISYSFIGFCLLFTIVYYIVPGKAQNFFLFLADIAFLISFVNRSETFICLGISVVLTYCTGLLLERWEYTSGCGYTLRKVVFILDILINLTILTAFKYIPFLNSVGSLMRIPFSLPDFSSLAPLGISFYTLQLLGYLIDVYCGRIHAEYNLFHFVLFSCYFPQMTSGPISRYGNLGSRLNAPRKFNYRNVTFGFQRMVWGFFKKLVISERAAVPVNTIFANYGIYSGWYIVLAAMLYSIQLYCDFSGCMDIVIGMSEVLGIPLQENFRTPYLSRSVSEFWRRWHISLSAWLRDYIYIPLGGSRCAKSRKYINIMITFFVSGLWHGGGWNYIFWGVMHGLYQILGEILKPVRRRLARLLSINPETAGFRLGQVIITFLLVSFAWIFFRADSLTTGFYMFRAMGTWNPALFSMKGILALGLDQYDLVVLFFSILVLLCIEILEQSEGIRVRIARQWIVLRWFLYLSLLMITLIYGEYGSGFQSESFIYAQF